MTGLKQGIDEKPKFSLLHNFNESEEFSKLVSLVQQLNNQNPGYKHVVKYVKDSAGPNHCKASKANLQQNFEGRGLLWDYQPPNIPLTNVCNASIFPAMLKHASAEHGLSNGGRMLEGK